MPSTTSSVDSIDFASSTVMTPSLPTFSIASAIMLPIVVSPLAEMVPTCAISFWPLVAFDCDFRFSTMAPTAASMPRLISIGLWPAATIFEPSRKIAWARTVAVVVPSPATSDVLDATSLTICAPMFSNLFSSSISLATVTPSFVTVGAPHDFSITTLRPFGPSVTFTASASVLTPVRMRARAPSENWMSLAAMMSPLLLDDPEDFVLAEDEVLDTVDLDLGARVLAEQNAVALLHVERTQRAFVVELTVADGDDLALDRLLLGGVRDDDATLGLLLLGEPLDHETILERS